MSMAENEGGEGGSGEKMEVDDKDQDYSEVRYLRLLICFSNFVLQVMNDPEFLQSVLQVVLTILNTIHLMAPLLTLIHDS